ncbi:MAG: DegT/DnrJ/EryC1/StrS family aminotransferase [Candidatus Wildermuthbacteria bacterium]|nr:DegT/DnrJ/EryC1/StrS family aminotransferase [Candidatus Wildermuthbacteria bacterium]
MMVDEKQFGTSRDELLYELTQRRIETKVYFYPVHKKKVYERYKSISLPNTDYVFERVLNLPLYSHMPEHYVKRVCAVIQALYHNKNRP